MPGAKTKLYRLVERQKEMNKAAIRAAQKAQDKHEDELRTQRVLSNQKDVKPPNVSGAEDA